MALRDVILKVFPNSVVARMEAESREWQTICDTCGTRTSIWDRGGLRYGAAGKPRSRMRCATCGKSTWHTISRA